MNSTYLNKYIVSLRWLSAIVALACLTSARAISQTAGFNYPGNILIADQFNNRVIEVSPAGEIVWQFGLGPNDFSPNSIIGVNDAERVSTDTVMCGTGTPPGAIPQAPNGASDNRVIVVNRAGGIIWQYGQFMQSGSGPNLLNTPVQAAWLPNRDFLITDQGNNRIIEVNMAKTIVWKYPGPNTAASGLLNSPNSAQLLENGDILIADELNNRAIEVTRSGSLVKTYTAGGTVNTVAFASRLPNGHTLLTDSGNSRAVEVDANDKIVWQYVTNSSPLSVRAPMPSRAIRLIDGDTVISDQFNNRVIRINQAGKIVASYGLPLAGGEAIGVNVGYGSGSAQQGLYAPYDAKVIDSFYGLSPTWIYIP